MKDRIHEGYGIKVNGKVFHVNPHPRSRNTVPVTVIEAPASKVWRLMEAVKEWYEADYLYRHAGPDTNLKLDWIDRMDDAEDTLSRAYAALQEIESDV